MMRITKYRRRKFLSLFGAMPLLPSLFPLKSFSKTKDRIIKGRRIVTGVDDKGKSMIASDGRVPENAQYGEEKISGSVLWKEDEVPVNIGKHAETLDGYTFNLEPPSGGMTAHILTLEPGFNGAYHQTKTIDFVFILSGKLELKLEEGRTILSPGDTVIQRGTNHAWRVIGNEPCTLGAVMLSATQY